MASTGILPKTVIAGINAGYAVDLHVIRVLPVPLTYNEEMSPAAPLEVLLMTPRYQVTKLTKLRSLIRISEFFALHAGGTFSAF